MQNIKVAVFKLLPKVRENKEKHIREYAEAIDGYKQKLIEMLETQLTEVKKGSKYEPIRLIESVNHVESYDNVITQLEWSATDLIELNAREVSQFIEDKWDWSYDFVNSTSLYKKM